MLNKMRNNPKTTRNVVIVAVLALLLLCGVGRASYLQMFSSYQMELNGDAEMELMQNSEFVDPGVTFYSETFFGGQMQVSAETQAQLEKELVVTGLDTLDVSTCDEYNIQYQYEEQVLTRLVRVLISGQQPSNNTTNPGGTTTNPGSTEPSGNQNAGNGDDSQQNGNPGNTQNPDYNDNSGTTNNPGGTKSPGIEQNTDSNKPAYNLPSNVTFDNANLEYDGKSHTITVSNLPEDIIPIYHSNTRRVVGTTTATVEFVLADSIKNNYSAVEPASMTATLTIRKATPSYKVPVGLTATVGQTLSDVRLPEGFTFEDTLTTSVGAEGVNIFKVTFTPRDTRNYKTVTGIEVRITVTNPGSGNTDIKKVALQLPSNVTFENTNRTYNTHPQSIFVRNLPDGIIPVYSGNGKTDVGTYTVRVTFTLSDELKAIYSSVEPASIKATLTIEKAEPKYTVPTNLTAVEGSTLRSVSLPKGFTFQDRLSTSVGPVGLNTFKVTFTPYDTKNYETVTDIEVKIRVTAKSGGGGGGDHTGEDPIRKQTPVINGPASVKLTEGTDVKTILDQYTATVNGYPVSGTFGISKVGDKYVVTFTPDNSSLYNNASKNVNVTFDPKPVEKPEKPVITGNTSFTLNEGDDINSILSGFKAFDKNGNEVPGTFSVAKNGDQYVVTFTPTDSSKYETVDTNVTVTINKPIPPVKPEKPTITGNTSFTLNEGDDINSILSGFKATDKNGNEVPGTFSVSKNGDQYVVTFTPTDSSKYETVDTNVTVTINKPTPPPTKVTPSIEGPSNIVQNSGESLEDAINRLFTAKDAEGNTIPGTFKYEDGKITFTPTDGSKYETAVKEGVTNTGTPGGPGGPVDPPKPGETKTEVSIDGPSNIVQNSGESLEDAINRLFTAKDAEGNTIPGTFKYEDGKVTFTPTDSDNYGTAVKENVTVGGAPGGTTPGEPGNPGTDPDETTTTKTQLTIDGPSNIVQNSGESLEDAINRLFTAKDAEGNTIPGTFKYEDGKLKFTPTDSDNYGTAVKENVEVGGTPGGTTPGEPGNPSTDPDETTTTKTQLTIEGPSSITQVSGESLEDTINKLFVAKDADGNTIPGTFQFEDGKVTFTPSENPDGYETEAKTGVTVDSTPEITPPTTEIPTVPTIGGPTAGGETPETPPASTETSVTTPSASETPAENPSVESSGDALVPEEEEEEDSEGKEEELDVEAGADEGEKDELENGDADGEPEA